MANNNHSYFKRLEEQAHELIRGVKLIENSTEISMIIARGIALTLNEIKEVRGVYEAMLKKVTSEECDVDTDLMRLAPKNGSQENHHFQDRQALKARLIQLNSERRRMIIDQSDKLRYLHNKLLEQVNKYIQIKR